LLFTYSKTEYDKNVHIFQNRPRDSHQIVEEFTSITAWSAPQVARCTASSLKHVSSV